MKQSIALLLILTGLSACFTPRRCNELVSKRYNAIDTSRSRTAGSIAITHTIGGVAGVLSSSGKTKSKLIPALVYWHWETRINCRLHAAIPVHTLATTLQGLSESKGLHKTLAGRRLELEVSSIPDRFTYKDKGHSVYLIFVLATMEQQGCYGEQAPLTVRYKLYDNSTVVKEGSISIPDNEISVEDYMKSAGGCTKAYFAKYDAHIELLTNKLYHKLVEELTM